MAYLLVAESDTQEMHALEVSDARGLANLDIIYKGVIADSDSIALYGGRVPDCECEALSGLHTADRASLSIFGYLRKVSTTLTSNHQSCCCCTSKQQQQL